MIWVISPGHSFILGNCRANEFAKIFALGHLSNVAAETRKGRKLYSTCLTHVQYYKREGRGTLVPTCENCYSWIWAALTASLGALVGSDEENLLCDITMGFT